MSSSTLVSAFGCAQDHVMQWLVLLGIGFVLMSGKKTVQTSGAIPVDVDEQLRNRVRCIYVRIGQVFGWRLPPLVFTLAVSNAASDGTRILVNLDWVKGTLAKHCRDLPGCAVTAIVGVLAHEVTHHVFGDAHLPAWAWELRRARERRADWHAGFVVAAMGLDVWHLERVLGDIDTCCDVNYDPPWQRSSTIRAGATAASTLVA